MLLRQTLIYLPAQILGPVAQLVAAIVWTFWLSPEQLGGYALIWSIQELAGIATLTWWTAFIQRYASSFDDDEQRKRLDRMETLVQLASAVAQVPLIVAACFFLFPGLASWSLLAAVGAFALSRNLANHLALRARAQNEAAAVTINVAAGALGGLALGFAALQVFEPSLEILLWAYALAQTAGIAASVPLMRLNVRPPKLDDALRSDGVRFGAPVALSSMLVWTGGHSIRFVVEAFSGRAAVGLMSVGWWLGLRLATFAGMAVMGAAYNLTVERMRSEGPDAARAQLATNAALLIGLLAPICAGGWLLAEPLARHLVDDGFREMTAAILPAALIAGAFRVFQDHCVDAGFLVFERSRYPAATSAIDAGTAILGSIVGIHLAGTVGAAWGCAAAAVASSAIGAAIGSKVYGFRIRSTDILAIFLALCAMTLAVWPFREAHSLFGLAAAIGIGACVYGFGLWALLPGLRRTVMRRA